MGHSVFRGSLAEHYRKAKPFTRLDIVILAVILALAIASAVFYYTGRTAGERAEIYIGGDLVGTYSLAQEKTIKFDIGVNVQIDNGKITVIYSDCPDKICLHAGYISKAGERIICAPNKFVIVIRGETGDYITGRKIMDR